MGNERITKRSKDTAAARPARRVKGERTVAVFTRLTEPDLRTLRHLARLRGTTASSLIREQTEAFLARERAKRAKSKAAGNGGTKTTTDRKADK